MTDKISPTPERLAKGDLKEEVTYTERVTETGESRASEYGRAMQGDADLFHMLARNHHLDGQPELLDVIEALRSTFRLAGHHQRVTASYGYTIISSMDDMPDRVVDAKMRWREWCARRPRDMTIVWRILDLTYETAEQVGACHSQYKTAKDRRVAGVTYMVKALESVSEVVEVK